MRVFCLLPSSADHRRELRCRGSSSSRCAEREQSRPTGKWVYAVAQSPLPDCCCPVAVARLLPPGFFAGTKWIAGKSDFQGVGAVLRLVPALSDAAAAGFFLGPCRLHPVLRAVAGWESLLLEVSLLLLGDR